MWAVPWIPRARFNEMYHGIRLVCVELGKKNYFFIIGYFKRLSHIIGRMARLILVNNPCQTGRTNETYA